MYLAARETKQDGKRMHGAAREIVVAGASSGTRTALTAMSRTERLRPSKR